MTTSSVAEPRPSLGQENQIATRALRKTGLAISWACHATILLILLLLAADAFRLGMDLRRWAWYRTEPIRYLYDVNNGLHWGHVADTLGMVETYRKVETTSPHANYRLDYLPVRLWVMKQWAHWIDQKYPGTFAKEGSLWWPTHTFKPQYAFSEPVLNWNAAGEAAAAVAAMLLVWVWLGRTSSGITSRFMSHSLLLPYRRLGRAALAGLLVWFNPALLWNSHVWPQWDVWIVPFFLWAALLAMLDGWFWAGVVLGVGGMLKGQLFAGAPLLVLWPLFAGRPVAAVRCVVGMALTVGIILWPWLTIDPSSHRWIIWASVAILLLSGPTLLGRFRVPYWQIGTIAGAIFGASLVASVAFRSSGFWWAALVAGGAALLAVGLLYSPLRRWPVWLAAAVAAVIWLCVPICHGSLVPFKVGFEYGARKYTDIARPEVNNLPAILNERYGWTLDDPACTLDFQLLSHKISAPLTIKQLLWYVYVALLVVCGIGAALQYRRRDPRLLIALAAPWLLFFAVVPQMHQRYLIWGAGVSALAVGVDWGLAIMHLFITAIAWLMEIHTMLADKPRYAPDFLSDLDGIHPGIGWAVMLCAAIFLYIALAPTTKRIEPQRAQRPAW